MRRMQAQAPPSLGKHDQALQQAADLLSVSHEGCLTNDKSVQRLWLRMTEMGLAF